MNQQIVARKRGKQLATSKLTRAERVNLLYSPHHSTLFFAIIPPPPAPLNLSLYLATTQDNSTTAVLCVVTPPPPQHHTSLNPNTFTTHTQNISSPMSPFFPVIFYPFSTPLCTFMCLTPLHPPPLHYLLKVHPTTLSHSLTAKL